MWFENLTYLFPVWSSDPRETNIVEHWRVISIVLTAVFFRLSSSNQIKFSIVSDPAGILGRFVRQNVTRHSSLPNDYTRQTSAQRHDLRPAFAVASTIQHLHRHILHYPRRSISSPVHFTRNTRVVYVNNNSSHCPRRCRVVKAMCCNTGLLSAFEIMC